MNRNHFLPALAVLIFSGCSTYKQAQTPDDVYYSPGAPKEEYVAAPANNSQGDYYSTSNDNYVRLKTQDPNRWSYFDDYNTDYYGGYSPMAYSPYGYGYGMGMGYGYGYGGFGISPWIGFSYWSPISYWNSYYTWNGYYNPYYGGVIVVNPKTGYNNTTRLTTFNPSSYSNNGFNRSNTRVNSAAYTPYNYSQTIRSSYNTNNNIYYRSNTKPAYRTNTNDTYGQSRTYSPSHSSSSSFGGSSGGGGGSRGGGGGGVSRPGR